MPFDYLCIYDNDLGEVPMLVTNRKMHLVNANKKQKLSKQPRTTLPVSSPPVIQQTAAVSTGSPATTAAPTNIVVVSSSPLTVSTSYPFLLSRPPRGESIDISRLNRSKRIVYKRLNNPPVNIGRRNHANNFPFPNVPKGSAKWELEFKDVTSCQLIESKVVRESSPIIPFIQNNSILPFDIEFYNVQKSTMLILMISHNQYNASVFFVPSFHSKIISDYHHLNRSIVLTLLSRSYSSLRRLLQQHQ